MLRTKTIVLILAVCCLVGSVAVAQDQYPPAGYDVVNTSANVSIYDPADSNLLVEVVAMEGRAVIWRDDPYTAAGDILTIDTRMDTLLLSGFSLSRGDSIFATLDRSGPLSTGQIYQQTAHVDFPAESYFDVSYRITFGSAPNPPSPGSGPNDDATYRGSFDYDLQNQSAVLSRSTSVSFSAGLPSDEGSLQGEASGTDQGLSELCVDCSATWKPENEACGTDNNGGCNSQPPTFDQVDCGDTVCGTAWADGGTRDTDWYEFTLAAQTTITVTGQADFPFVLGFVDTADCALASAVDPAAIGAECEVISASRVAGPGTYWVFAAPNTGTGVICGQNSEYWFTLECSTPIYVPNEPPHMIDTIWQIPPHGRVYKDPRRRPVIDSVTNDTLGWVWHEHAIDPPDPGEDTLPTIGFMQVWIGPDQPSPTQPPDDVIELQGQAIIHRGEATTDGTGHRTIQTEILSMDLSGFSPVFGEVILQLPQPAQGQIRGQLPSPQMFPADVFYDVDYKVILGGEQIIQPLEPPQMYAQIEAIPPSDVQLTTQGEPHPVHNPENPGVIIGWVLPIHWVNPPADPPPTGACCEAQTGLCFEMTAADCAASGGTYQGDGVPCDPNPCDGTCPTGWTPGIDTITFSAFEIDIYDPNDNTIYLGTAYAFGANMIVQRNAPYEESPGIWRMDTDIIAFGGSGASPLLGGPFTVGLDPNGTSSGFIRMCDSCDDNWAESFWNIDYQISTSQPPPRDLLHGNAQMELPCSEGWDPFPGGGPFRPPNGHSYVDPRKVPIYDDNGEIIGYTMKRHHVADDELGACCDLFEGTCRMTTQANCDPATEVWQGPGTTCFPNPCICTGWTPGIDTLLYSAFTVELFDPSDSTVSLGTLTAFGASMIVQRGVPYEVSPGIWRMDTDIIAFGGGGTSPIVGGLFTLELDPDLISGGWIQMCDSCDDNWAESHWDINYRILTSLPAPMNILKGNAQMDLPCDAQWNPFPGGVFTPPNGSTYIDPRKVPIYDADGNIIGYTMKKHRVDKDPMGACCEPQGGILCFIVTAEECEAFGGIYLGDNTVCNPNPCDSTCPTGWTPGIDTILYSAFVVDYYDPTDSTVLLGTLTAFGANMVVQRSAPYEESPGIWRMNTTILEFGGAGTSALVGGAFTLQLDASLASTGFIRMCDSCNDNWAESKFTVHYQILTTQPAPDDVLEGTASMHLPCSDQWNPFPGGVFTPPNGHSYVDPRKVPIYDADGTIIGYTIKKHRVDKDPMGACCDPPSGACRITTAQDCEQSGGVYLGDNVPCDPNPCGPAVGACCEQGTGLCFVMTEQQCLDAQGTYIGDGVSCNPNPCDSCETGWTPGVDTIPTHDFEIELYDNTGTILVTTLTATGIDMVVQRSAPFLVSPGIYRMNTQIIQLDGSGNDPVLGGPFEIHLAAAPLSTGYIQMCDSCNDNWAESFFSVHWIITTTLPFPMDVLTGDPADMHLDCTGNWDPFASGAFLPPVNIPYHDPRIVPIYDASGQIIGYTRKKHTPTRCCIDPMRGNVDYDPGDIIDISDLVYLVDYMFTGGPVPPCLAEANVDCIGGDQIDIADLVYLVDYMFTGGPPPCPCDCVPGEVCYPDWGNGSSSTMGEETLRRWSSFARPSNAPSNTPRGFEFEPTR